MTMTKLEAKIVNQMLAYGMFIADNDKENQVLITLAKRLPSTVLIKGQYLYALFTFAAYMKDVRRDDETSLSKKWSVVDVTML